MAVVKTTFFPLTGSIKYFSMELSKTKASIIASLGSRKMRRRHSLFVAEGEKCVSDTLGAFRLDCLVATHGWLSTHPSPEGVAPEKIMTCSPETMRKISSLSTPSEVIAVFHMPYDDGEAPAYDPSVLNLLLDGIQDPGNLGTIIRTADWFGIKTIYCSKDTVDLFNPKTIQATMGSLKRVQVVYTDLPGLLLSNHESNVYGLQLDGKDIFQSQLQSKGAIVMGNEGNGISDEIRALVTNPLLIPPTNPSSHPESLNVAVATAITLAEFRKKS